MSGQSRNPGTTNFNKFQTGNPVVRKLIGGFFEKLRETVSEMKPQSVLDAGCGEGETFAQLEGLLPDDLTGFDLNPESVEFTKKRHPDAKISVQNIYNLPFEENSFDLVLCCEVLEHLEKPADALAELRRVSKNSLVLTVPWEPWFQVGSLVRGKYLKSWGNHPEHINHWNPKSFSRFLDGKVSGVEVSTAFPWLMASCKK